MPRARVTIVLGLLLVFLAAGAAASSDSVTPEAGDLKPLPEGQPHVQPLRRQGRLPLGEKKPQHDLSNVLLVTLLDGRIVGLDKQNGARLWTYDSGAPLVSVKQTEADSEAVTVFPGVDGSLYAYHNRPSGPQRLERLPMTLPDLVTSSPTMASDGSVVLGTRMSTVFALDKATGQLVRLLSGIAGSVAGPLDLDGVQLPPSFDPRTMVLLGREDFIVRSLHTGSGEEMWNATFARVSLPQHPLAHQAHRQTLGGAGQLPENPVPPSVFAVAADNTLQAYDAATGFRRWAVPFDVPPMGAYDASLGADGTNQLDNRVNKPRAMGESASKVKPALGAPADVKGDSVSEVMVGMLKGSLYAIPGDHLIRPADWKDGKTVKPAVVPPKQGLQAAQETPEALPAAPTPSPSAAAAGASQGSDEVPDKASTSTAVQPVTVAAEKNTLQCDMAGQLTDGFTALAIVPGSGAVTVVGSSGRDGANKPLTCPLGVHTVSETKPPPHDPAVQQHNHSGSVPWLPAPRHMLLPAPVPQLPHASDAGGVAAHARDPAALLTVLILTLAGILILLTIMWVQKRVRKSEGGSTPSAWAQSDNETKPLIGNDPSAATSITLPAKGRGRNSRKGGSGAAAGAPGRPAARPVSPDVENVKTGETSSACTVSEPGSRDTSHHAGTQNYHAVATSASSARQTIPEAGSEPPTTPTTPAVADILDTLTAPTDPANADTAQSDHTADKSESHDTASSGESGGATAQSGGRSGGSQAGSTGQQGAVVRHDSGGSGAGGEGQVRRQGEVQQDGSMLMGRLKVGPGILGYGSAGTIVYEGWMDGRAVAVKRLLRQFYDLARKEIEVLIVSDEHPNVVRCFAMEEDREFVYLALERCKCTLSEALTNKKRAARYLDPVTGGPSAECLLTCRQIVQGLASLHERGIVHRDLKPHNVLLTEAGRVKLSDMGLSKQLVAEQSSFESHGAGGSSGWQAPEQLIARGGGQVRQTRSMDVFSLGCVLHFCMTGGKHPFGDSFERDMTILRGQPNVAPLQPFPEACNLVLTMLAKDPEARPVMSAVAGHPVWWSDEHALKFLIDISDRVENEDREPDKRLLQALESLAPAALQLSPAAEQELRRKNATWQPSTVCNWGQSVDEELVLNLYRYRRYDYTTVRDLLRVIRNKRNHFREMPEHLQARLGPIPSGFLRYFTSKFPHLIMGVWVFAVTALPDEDHLASQYYPGGAASYQRFINTFMTMHAKRFEAVKNPARAITPPPGSRRVSDKGAKSPPPPPPPQAAAAAQSAGGAASPLPPAAQRLAVTESMVLTANEFALSALGQQPSQPQPQPQQPPQQPQLARPLAVTESMQLNADIAAKAALAVTGRLSTDPPSHSNTLDTLSELTPAAVTNHDSVGALTTSTGASTSDGSHSTLAGPPSLASGSDHDSSQGMFSGGSEGSVDRTVPFDTLATGPAGQPGQASGSGAGDVRGARGSQQGDGQAGTNARASAPAAETSGRGGNTGAGGFTANGTGDPSALYAPSIAQYQPNMGVSTSTNGVAANGQGPSPSKAGSSNGANTTPKAAEGGLSSLAPHPMPIPAGPQVPLAAPQQGVRAPLGVHGAQVPGSNGVGVGGMTSNQPVVVGYEVDPEGDKHPTFVREFPKRPGVQVCDFFTKTGHCKYGDACVFDHPPELSVALTSLGLPLRPGQPVCTFYLKNSNCKFGPSCKFHHPPLRPMFAGQALVQAPVPEAAAGVGAPVGLGVGPVLAPGLVPALGGLRLA